MSEIPTGQPPKPAKLLLMAVLALAVYLTFMAGLFLAAGGLNWTRGWIFLLLMPLTFLVNIPVVMWKNPALVGRRLRKPKITKTFDRMYLYVPSLLAVFIVAALDGGRFHWSSPPFAAVYAGVILHVLGDMPMLWALAVNPYLETTVRIQTESGHKVVTTGPYRFVRHPMYAGGILMFSGWPLILGSLWSYVPACVVVALFVFRTALEDRTLRNELPGYEEYTRRTRYRLLPHVW